MKQNTVNKGFTIGNVMIPVCCIVNPKVIKL